MIPRGERVGRSRGLVAWEVCSARWWSGQLVVGMAGGTSAGFLSPSTFLRVLLNPCRSRPEPGQHHLDRVEEPLAVELVVAH